MKKKINFSNSAAAAYHYYTDRFRVFFLRLVATVGIESLKGTNGLPVLWSGIIVIIVPA
jgi:hypothetical protein